MAWYKTGNVSITNGATAVIAIGTKFATNARVGDGFRGPDGEWYEVTNIASETTLGIYPPYQGVTINGSTNYMIAPLQGYNKDSADRMRVITDQFIDFDEEIAAAAAYAASALVSQNSALVSEASAEASATSATNSATSAVTSEANALASKNAAAISATNAANSATSADNSKTSAATSATNAANSAAEAANKQPLNSNLTYLSGLTPTTDRLPFFSSESAMGLLPAGVVGKSVLAATTTSLGQTALDLIPQSSATDTTANRVVKTGGFGLGTPIDVTNANSATIGGANYRLSTPFTNGPNAAPYTISVTTYDNEVTQQAVLEGVSDAIVYYRKRNGSTNWGSWSRVPFSDANGVLPIAAGGTGGTTPAEARAALQLGPTAMLAIGGIEITAATPVIDFHFNNTATDYDVRLINSAAGTLNALVTNVNEFRVNGATVWNDSNCGTKLGSIPIGGVGTYGFFLTNTGLTPGATTSGGNLQYAFAVGNGGTSPTGLWRCMGDTTAGQRTLFQRIS